MERAQEQEIIRLFHKQCRTGESGIQITSIGVRELTPGQPCLAVSVVDLASKAKIEELYKGPLPIDITVTGRPMWS